MKLRAIATLALAVFTVAAAASNQSSSARDIIVGTGPKGSIYHQAGRAICALVNRHANDLVCSPLPATDSVFNIDNVRGGALEFGVVPADVQYHAVEKSGPFSFVDATYEGIRAVLSVSGEAFTLVARRDSGIRRLADLEGKRINIGQPRSTERAMMDRVLAAKGWNRNSFGLVEELPHLEHSLALCHDRVQATVFVVGHPSETVRQAIELCDAGIVEVSNAEIDKLIEGTPYLTREIIPAGIYAGAPELVTSFGVKAVLVTSGDVEADLVYDVVKSVFDNLEQFKGMHPAFGPLNEDLMRMEGLFAPLHDGARRYYAERGLL